ncbi:MAG: RluA family pseudouridine synthase [Spirochaetaceae bacterium]|jgi:23S rRNA pseudouridine955/2504/2580 synthase|nr:RluA family pseudouridine synthase [Spirochaetaceae bacterium]
MEYKGSMALELLAAENDDNRRLDRVLRKALDSLALSAIHRLLRTGKVRVNGKKAPADCRVRAGDTIAIDTAAIDTAIDKRRTTAPAPRRPPRDTGQDTAQDTARDTGQAPEPSLSVLYEGGGLLILNKPPGTAVHGRNSLDTRVKSRLEAELPPSLSFSPGPLHRLDVPTSGVLAFSSSLAGAREFTRLLREGKLRKYYLAVVQGKLDRPETWEDTLLRDKKNRTSAVVPDSANPDSTSPGSKNPGSGTPKARAALTLATPLANSDDHSLLLLEIRSGRTHQIRSQAASRGHPLWGDTKYGGKRGRILLHAVLLVFPHDRPPDFPSYCFAPPPPRFLETALALFHYTASDLQNRVMEHTR